MSSKTALLGMLVSMAWKFCSRGGGVSGVGGVSRYDLPLSCDLWRRIHDRLLLSLGGMAGGVSASLLLMVLGEMGSVDDGEGRAGSQVNDSRDWRDCSESP